jgi:hypothetical protein
MRRAVVLLTTIGLLLGCGGLGSVGNYEVIGKAERLETVEAQKIASILGRPVSRSREAVIVKRPGDLLPTLCILPEKSGTDGVAIGTNVRVRGEVHAGDGIYQRILIDSKIKPWKEN